VAKFEKGNPGGPGRPPVDARVKRARAILKDCVLPALPGIAKTLLSSRNPKIVLDALRLFLPYVEAPAAVTLKTETKTQVQDGIAERTLKEIWAKRQTRRVSEPPEAEAPPVRFGTPFGSAT
jgi:hypothetical protein